MAIEKVELKDALNALVTNTNIDKVTGVLGGVPSNIGKDDLASVMASLIFEKGTTSGDLNNLKAVGSYRYTATSVNTPGPNSVGIVTVTKSEEDRLTQTAVDYYYGTWNRMFWGAEWTAWQRIDNFGYNTIADLSSAVAGQMKYNASKMVFDFRTSTTTDVTLPSYGMILLSIVYGSELYGLYLIQCWDGVISIKTINESGTKKFQLGYNTYQKYITITSPSAVPSVRLGWINITD